MQGINRSTLWFVLGAGLLFVSSCASPTPTPEPDPTSTPAPTNTPEPAKPSKPELFMKLTGDDRPLNTPYGVALAQDGSFYVSDSGNNRILKFDGAGNLLATWDQSGSGDGEFKSMGFGGLAVDAEGNVFVVDNGNFRIQKFDNGGNFIAAWGSEGTENGQFVRAIGIAVDSEAMSMSPTMAILTSRNSIAMGTS